MLTCNQNGLMGKLVHEGDEIEVWKTPDKESETSGWVGVFNRGDRLKAITVSKAFLGLGEGDDVSVSNIWQGRKQYELQGKTEVEIDVNSGGVLFLRYE